MQTATIYSVYMDNIPVEVRTAQRQVVEKFMPTGWRFEQYRSGSYSHPAAMTICLATNTKPLTIFLDIDCIPLSRTALELLGARAEKGVLVGAAQRANHINNGEHLYVGPFCCAFSNRKYLELGSPSFYETARGDVGEELTYRWQAAGAPIYLLWPSLVQQPLWELTQGIKFGMGTTYEDKFYHEFCARATAGNFVRKCEEIIQSEKGKVA